MTNKSFKVIRLKFKNHPFLNDQTGEEAIELVSKGEIHNGPYSSVLIGANGVGKSQILRIIADIIEDLKARSLSKYQILGNIKFDYEMIFYSNGKTYIITLKNEIEVKPNNKKNRVVKYFLNEFNLEKNEVIGNLIKISDELLPPSIITLSYLVNDKFRFEYRKDNAFNTYLGLRDTAGSARTRSFSNRVIQFVIKHLLEFKDKIFLQDVIRLIGYDENYLDVRYKLRYKEHFFNGKLTVRRFKELFEDWKSFSKRSTEPFSIKYFKKIVEEKIDLEKIVALINRISENAIFNLSNDDRFSINLLDEKVWLNDIEYLDTLQRLDLIEQSTLSFRKSSKNVSEPDVDLASFSSGEFHLFTSFVALKSTIKPGSVILIDEPEISLHPNWQMKYIHLLKKFYSTEQFSGCHFIIATHSHFIVADLKNETSEVVKISRDSKNNILAKRIKSETYGMSAESILYYIFQLRSTRNFYFEMEIREMLSLISGKENGKNEISPEGINRVKELHDNLKRHVLNDNDPLNQILNIANGFITQYS